jgi:chromosome segregation ATPase
MRAETIERLSAKGHFSSEQALALAEAMDTVIEKAQLVTVPILDSRLGFIEGRFLEVGRQFAQIDRQFAQVDQRFAQIDHRFAQVDQRFAQIEDRFAEVNRRFDRVDARFAQIDVRFEQMEARFATVDARFEKMDARFDAVNVRIDGVEARMKNGFDAIDVRFKSWGLRIILATVVSQAALGPVGVSALELARRLLSTVGH